MRVEVRPGLSHFLCSILASIAAVELISDIDAAEVRRAAAAAAAAAATTAVALTQHPSHLRVPRPLCEELDPRHCEDGDKVEREEEDDEGEHEEVSLLTSKGHSR